MGFASVNGSGFNRTYYALPAVKKEIMIAPRCEHWEGGRKKKNWRANLFFFFLLLAVLTIILPSLKTPKSFSTPSARSLRASPSSQASGAWGRCWQHCGGCLGPACPWGQAGALGAVWLLGKGYRIASKAGCRSR